jgi:hypothetical protein
MLEEGFVHILSDHHLFVELDQEILSLLMAHLLHLILERTNAELLFEREFDRLRHGVPPEGESIVDSR